MACFQAVKKISTKYLTSSRTRGIMPDVASLLEPVSDKSVIDKPAHDLPQPIAGLSARLLRFFPFSFVTALIGLFCRGLLASVAITRLRKAASSADGPRRDQESSP